MRVCGLLLIFGFLLWSADKPIPLALEGNTILHVGDLAVLEIPTDRRYSHFDGNTEVGNALTLVHHSKSTTLYRAVRPGQETIVIGPEVPRGECISCGTLHYFITVVARK